MAANPPLDLMLSPIDRHPHTVREWLTTFHLLFVAVDPGHARSRWIVPTAARVLKEYDGADCRVAWLVAGDAADARKLLGRWAKEILTFADPELKAVTGFGFGALPAIVHLGMDGAIVNAVEGWDPPAWRELTAVLSRQMKWSRPMIPAPTDPGAYAGAPLPKL